MICFYLLYESIANLLQPWQIKNKVYLPTLLGISKFLNKVFALRSNLAILA